MAEQPLAVLGGRHALAALEIADHGPGVEVADLVGDGLDGHVGVQQLAHALHALGVHVVERGAIHMAFEVQREVGRAEVELRGDRRDGEVRVRVVGVDIGKDILNRLPVFAGGGHFLLGLLLRQRLAARGLPQQLERLRVGMAADGEDGFLSRRACSSSMRRS